MLIVEELDCANYKIWTEILQLILVIKLLKLKFFDEMEYPGTKIPIYSCSTLMKKNYLSGLHSMVTLLG